MFMNDPDFDDEFQQHSPGFEYGQAFPSPDSKKRTEDDNRAASYGNAGMGTPQNGRARVLAQQRELLQKKRQSNLLSGGMVRSSLESTGAPSPFRQSVDSQYTSAVPQFSAPRLTAKDPSYDASPEKDSEFTKKSRTAQSHGSASVSRYSRNPKYSDEEDDERLNEAHRRAADRRGDRDQRSERDNRDSRDNHNTSNSYSRDNRDYNSRDNNYRDRERGGARRTGGRRSQFEDDEDDDEEDYRRGGGNNGNSYQSGSNYNRRDQAPSSSSAQRNNYRDRDDDSYDGDRRNNNNSTSQSQSKWAGATGGRDVHHSNSNTAPNSAGTDGRDSRERGSGGSGGGYRANTSEVVNGNAPQATMVGGNQRGNGTPTPQQQQQQQVPLAIVAPNLTNMREFLTSPLPKNNGTLQCYIRRNKSGTNKLFPIYSLYLKEGDVFLMASKKRPKNKTSNYLISMDQNDLHRQGRGYLGKLRSNFVGTEFQVFDSGVNPKDCDPDEVANSSGGVRCELGSVMYAANVLGSRGPRKMQVALPGLDESGRITQWKDTSDSNANTSGHNSTSGTTASGDDILTRMKDRNMRDLSYLINKPPRWNEQVGAYVLNFNGRVTMASVKNFQLVDPDEQNAVVLQFGRVGKDEFTMDLQHPISPFQAFAVTLSSFDSKIACD